MTGVAVTKNTNVTRVLAKCWSPSGRARDRAPLPFRTQRKVRRWNGVQILHREEKICQATVAFLLPPDSIGVKPHETANCPQLDDSGLNDQCRIGDRIGEWWAVYHQQPLDRNARINASAIGCYCLDIWRSTLSSRTTRGRPGLARSW
jgi:hypothetical protein